MRISDWSSDVCSSDLRPLPYAKVPADDLWECNYCPIRALCYKRAAEEARVAWEKGQDVDRLPPRDRKDEGKVRLPKAKKDTDKPVEDRKSGVEGTGCAARVELGGRLIINKKNT